ncbi:MAG: 50S ribosomal protein L6 [bacterium]|nr:50S ribosomal protein L6 [bacterium]
MSRLAKRPITIPALAELKVLDGTISVKGPKGTLQKSSHRLISIDVGEGGVQVATKASTIEARALLGTYASHVRNMLHGVTTGYSKKLIVEGVGFKWEVVGDKLNLSLGFSHPVVMPIPAGLAVRAERNTLTIDGFDKELVGQFAANVRARKVPEPYKGKGIRYDSEVIRRKQGKKAA